MAEDRMIERSLDQCSAGKAMNASRSASGGFEQSADLRRDRLEAGESAGRLPPLPLRRIDAQDPQRK
jgi:hypothetical protein